MPAYIRYSIFAGSLLVLARVAYATYLDWPPPPLPPWWLLLPTGLLAVPIFLFLRRGYDPL